MTDVQYYQVKDGDGYYVEAYGRDAANVAARCLHEEGHPLPIRACPDGVEPLGSYGTIGSTEAQAKRDNDPARHLPRRIIR